MLTAQNIAMLQVKLDHKMRMRRTVFIRTIDVDLRHSGIVYATTDWRLALYTHTCGPGYFDVRLEDLRECIE